MSTSRTFQTSQSPRTSQTPLEPKLTPSADNIQLERWIPPQAGTMPALRIGKRWINILWAIPLAVALLLPAVAAAQWLRTIPAVQQFIAQYPGDTGAQPVLSGYPLWLQLLHFFNLFFIMFIIRAGIQILADHPRLYWRRDSTPGSEWFRFQHAVPRDRIWTSTDDSVSLPTWLGIPGVRHTVGLARWWHFVFDLFWILIGIVFYILLFTTDQWHRLVPANWTVFPNALSTALQYLSLQFPVEHTWTAFNGLQQLAYFTTVFIAAPLAIITGLMQGPAFGNKLGWFAKVVNRQASRTLHFLVLCWFLFFIFVHVTLVFITGLRVNLNHMFGGTNDDSWNGLLIFIAAMLIVAIGWALASPLTLKHARRVQKIGETLLGGLKSLIEVWQPSTQYQAKDISPYFWVNGKFATFAAYDALRANGFADYQLPVYGLVEKPQAFSFAALKRMPKQTQITQHFCIQGWSGVAEWGGVPVRDILELVKPKPEARYVVFYSFAEEEGGGLYYNVHTIKNMRHALSILAYEMNGAALAFEHGAPLRLRCENELGFKMVKWIQAIELVDDLTKLGAGQGGYDEDHKFYGNHMPI